MINMPSPREGAPSAFMINGLKKLMNPIRVLLPLALLACPATLSAQESSQPHSLPKGMSEKGIWIGTIDLCHAGPVDAKAGFDDYGGFPIVNITLPATLRDALAELTTASVGKQLPIRVDGKVVSEPYVNEPILGGLLQISGIDRAEADRIVAMLQVCPAEPVRTGG